MPHVLPIMTPGSRATGPEPFHYKRGERCRSGAARAKPFKSNGYLARARRVWATEPFTPYGGLRVTPDSHSINLYPWRSCSSPHKVAKRASRPQVKR